MLHVYLVVTSIFSYIVAMSYEVTATRRRPQRFEDLAGQEFVAETLRNSIQSQKIAHAYLFSGPRGCGKTSTARILAKALNCTHGPTATPCGECQMCKEITKGACTDVIEIDGASNTSVNDVRQIKDEVLFPPQSCRYKIYIIDEVHMLSTSAFNALLKTIEEPPPYVIFIFATTELQKVPATIKSRCQQFNFRLVPVERVKELLAEACKDINIQAEDEALYWIARESTGSVRDSYTLFDQVAAFSGDKITYEKIRDKLGLVGVDRLNAIFEDCAQSKTQDALTKLDGFLQNGISIEQLISNATDYLRSLLLIKNGITKEALLGQAAERYSRMVLGAWNSVQIERGLSLLLQLYRDIRYSLSPRYELELVFSRLSWLNQYVSPAEVKAAIDSAHALLSGAPQAPSTAHTAQGSLQAPAQSGSPSFAYTPHPAAQADVASSIAPLTAPAASQMPSQAAFRAAPAQDMQVPSFDTARTSGTQAVPHGMPMFSALAGGGGQPQAAAPQASAPQTPAQSGMAPVSSQSAVQQSASIPQQNAPQAISPQAAPAPVQPVPSPQTGLQPAPAVQPLAQVPPATDFSDSGQPLPPLEMEQYDDGLGDAPGASAPAFATLPAGQASTGAPSFSNGGAVPPEQAEMQQQAVALAQKGVREQLIAKLTVNDTLLAALLMRTGSWTQNGNAVSAEVDSAFLKSQLDAQATKIASELTALTGRQTAFSVHVRVLKPAATPQQLPHEVQLVCSMFKGAVTNVVPKEKTAQTTQKQSMQAVDDEAPVQEDENDESL